MNYNYPQPQYQPTAAAGYGGYRPTPQYMQWGQTSTSSQVRPVSSIEEVKASPIDFDGSVFYFADVANKRIYTKQINLDGTVSINLYELKECPTNIITTDQSANSSYVTKEEFQNVITELNNRYEQMFINSTNNNNNNKIKEDVEQPAAQPIEEKKALFSF